MMKNLFFVYTVTQSNASNTKQTGTSNIYHYGWFSVSNFHSIFERICYALNFENVTINIIFIKCKCNLQTVFINVDS